MIRVWFVFVVVIISVVFFSCKNRNVSQETNEEVPQLTEIEEEYFEEDEEDPFKKEVIVKNYNPDNEVVSNCRLQMTMELIFSETSKDSNTKKSIVSISNCRVDILLGYYGHVFEETEIIIHLNKEKEQQIIDYLKNNQLNVNVNEEQKTEGTGRAGTLILEVKSPFVAKINIKGKTKIWGSDEIVEKEWGKEYVESRTNLKNKHYFSKANSFVNFLENL